MVVKEKEAGNKICPVMSARNPNDATYCIGETCMAWRVWQNASYGYCGLAGKPEIVQSEEIKNDR